VKFHGLTAGFLYALLKQPRRSPQNTDCPRPEAFSLYLRPFLISLALFTQLLPYFYQRITVAFRYNERGRSKHRRILR
jgi:hypothetical protein